MKDLRVRTAAEVAKILGVSREYVRQVEKRALIKLRRGLLASLHGELPWADCRRVTRRR